MASYGLVDVGSLAFQSVDADSANSINDALGQGRVTVYTTFIALALAAIIVPAGGGLYIIGGTASFSGNSARDFQLRDGAAVLASFDESDVYLKTNGQYGWFGMCLASLAEGNHTLYCYAKLDTGSDIFYVPSIGVVRCA